MKILMLIIPLLAGCAFDQKPDAYVQNWCFKGQASLVGGAVVASGNAMGEIDSNGLFVFGELPKEAVIAIANQGCKVGEAPKE